MKSAIFAYAFDEARAVFFERFRSALQAQGIELVVISNRPALARLYPQVRILARPRSKPHERDNDIIHDCLEYRVGNRNLIAAQRFICALEDCLQILSGEYEPLAVFIWNGSDLPGRVMARFAREKNVRTLFFENSNISGKMIVDTEGVNAQCSVARDPSLLKNYPSPLSAEQFSAWKQEYIASQLCTHKVHQAKNVRQIHWSFLSDRAVQLLHGIPQYEKYPFLMKAFRKIDAVFYRPRDLVLDVLPRRYVFLPLQVQSDTQLIFNSEIDNLKAMRLVFERLEPGQKLVVKQHPAEPDKRVQRHYSRIIAENGGIETTNNTFDLILNAEKVFTINSTAGLQAKLMGKPVECLGQAVFAAMDDCDLNRYIHGFMVPVEFFRANPLIESEVDAMLARIM